MTDPAPPVVLEINGESRQFPAGTRLIDACSQIGVDVPHFCYHTHLSVAGNCRMCAVEIEGQRGLPISCNTIVAPGMKVKTESERVKAARQSVMEFLLVNHPIDCPICDQAGECKLQVYYMAHDLKPSRLDVEKVEYAKRVPVGPRVTLDQERCVECTRCIRFCDEVTETHELRMVNRGDRNAIDCFPGTSLDNHYSVNTADICPVGALTQTDFRFKARAWFLKPVKSICPGCAKGCNVVVDYYEHAIVDDHNGKAYRLRPRVNDAVNAAWMCDFGRLEYRPVNDDRLTVAMLRGEPRGYDEVLTSARQELARHGRNALIVTSFDASNEEMEALRRLARETLGGATVVAVPVRPDGFSDDFLLRGDKHPNRRGAEALGLARSYGELPTLLEGRTAALFHRVDFGLDLDGRVAAAFGALETRAVIAANASPAADLATHLLPGASFIEREGTWINEQGRVQRFRRAYRARKGTRE
ncbi:MAG TPA: 2Fe-2S iron-sulfur cluster-binding protein, partial [Planctomycetota bacterium]|nr:2Fe-2S iron-sulfur cluster-binding protein [Planctomycetota bacterium]